MTARLDTEYRLEFSAGNPGPVLEPDVHFGSRWKERLPEKIFQAKLSETEVNKFKTFLEREDVVRQGSFLSSAPAPAEYRFIIGRLTGPQSIEVIGFNFHPRLPETVSGQYVTGLSAIICVAKLLAHKTSNTVEAPPWCQGVEPFDSR